MRKIEETESATFIVGSSDEQLFSYFLLSVKSNKSEKQQFFMDSMDNLFFIFETEMEEKSYTEKLEYVNHINKKFYEFKGFNTISEHPVEILNFEFHLMRWTNFWRELIKYKTKNTYPNFKFDIEHMQIFSSKHVPPLKGIKYLKHEYGRLVKDYKPFEGDIADIKDRIRTLIRDLSVIKTPKKKKKQELEKTESIIKNTEQNEEKEKIEYIGTSEAMSLLKVRRETLWNYVKKGKLKKYGTSIRHNLYDKSEIINLLEQKIKD